MRFNASYAANTRWNSAGDVPTGSRSGCVSLVRLWYALRMVSPDADCGMPSTAYGSSSGAAEPAAAALRFLSPLLAEAPHDSSRKWGPRHSSLLSSPHSQSGCLGLGVGGGGGGGCWAFLSVPGASDLAAPPEEVLPCREDEIDAQCLCFAKCSAGQASLPLQLPREWRPRRPHGSRRHS